MNLYQKLALASLISVLFLLFVGATVRVTGAGMGCPDWPTCWGLLIPPTSADQVDFDKLPIERFKKKAERMGRDPSLINEQKLREEFNPRHVWTEFINRLCSLPVGFFSVATLIVAFSQLKNNPKIFILSLVSLLLVLANAIMGARVVYSGLSPGIITIHLALAMLLICVLTYCVWAGADQPKKLNFIKNIKASRWLVAVLLIAVIVEGVMGAQLREMTDELAKSHINLPRESWIAQLESTWIYLIHRSFSWLILILAIVSYFIAGKSPNNRLLLTPFSVLAIVFAQMILGVIMAQIHIYSWVQVLHVGLAAILLTFNFHWLLLIPKKNHPPAGAGG